MSSVHRNPILMFTISVSIFGVFITMIFALNLPIVNESFLWRKTLIGSIFSLICIFGIFAAFLPKQCSRPLHFRKGGENFPFHQNAATAKGHHPACERFSAHVIRISNYTLCAACTGLFLGGLVALTGTLFYFFCGWRVGEMSFSIVLIGVVGVVLGFFQLKFRKFLRLMFNVFFVVGAFLVLAGIDELTQSLFVDLFLTVLIVFWLMNRIMLSQWDHWRICHSCKFPCELKKSRV